MEKLFRTAERNNIEVTYLSLPSVRSASAQAPGGCMVGLDYSLLWGGSEERTHLAHELGHCITGSFYNMYAPLDDRRRHEQRATRWAIKALLPLDALSSAFADGRTEPWELAEYFGVTEDLIHAALSYYYGV